MSSSDYHSNTSNTRNPEIDEYVEEASIDARAPENYYSAGEEKTVDYPSFPQPQLPSHNHLDQTMFQNYDDLKDVSFPEPYSHDKQAQHQEEEEYHNNEVLPEHESFAEEYNQASTSAAIYAPETEEKVAQDQDVEVPEASPVDETHAVVLSNVNEKEQEQEEQETTPTPTEEGASVNRRDTLIGEEDQKEEKAAMNDEQAIEAQRLEDERKLHAKMEDETKDRVFQPEAEPEAVYVPSVKPRTDIADQSCCWGCLAWICCWSTSTADKK